MQPTNVVMRNPSRDLRDRLGEDVIIPGAALPGTLGFVGKLVCCREAG